MVITGCDICIVEKYHGFLTSWHTCWRHHILFDVTTYFLTSWRTFHIFDVMAYFVTLWRAFYIMAYILILFYDELLSYDKRFDVMSCIPYFLTPWRTCWRHDVLFDIMKYFPYYLIYDLPFEVRTYFVTCDVFFNITTFFLTSWRTFWHHDIPVDVMMNLLTS